MHSREILYHRKMKNISWNLHFSNSFRKIVSFTKFLPKMCESTFPKLPQLCEAILSHQWKKIREINLLLTSLVKRYFNVIFGKKSDEREFSQFPHYVLLINFEIFSWNQKEWDKNECQNWLDEFLCEDAHCIVACVNHRNLLSPRKFVKSTI